METENKTFTESFFETFCILNKCIHFLEHVVDMPDDVMPTIDGKQLTPEQKENFILGIKFALANIGDNLNTVSKNMNTKPDNDSTNQED